MNDDFDILDSDFDSVVTFLTYLAGFDYGKGEVSLIKREGEHIVNFICNGPIGNVTLTWSPAGNAALS